MQTTTIQECKARARARWRVAFSKALACSLRGEARCSDLRIANATYNAELSLCAAQAAPVCPVSLSAAIPCSCGQGPQTVWENQTGDTVRLTFSAEDACRGDCPGLGGSYLSYTDANGRPQSIGVGDPATGLGTRAATIRVFPGSRLDFFCSGTDQQDCGILIQVE